jgi:hypothetical protein
MSPLAGTASPAKEKLVRIQNAVNATVATIVRDFWDLIVADDIKNERRCVYHFEGTLQGVMLKKR